MANGRDAQTIAGLALCVFRVNILLYLLDVLAGNRIIFRVDDAQLHRASAVPYGVNLNSTHSAQCSYLLTVVCDISAECLLVQSGEVANTEFFVCFGISSRNEKSRHFSCRNTLDESDVYESARILISDCARFLASELIVARHIQTRVVIEVVNDSVIDGRCVTHGRESSTHRYRDRSTLAVCKICLLDSVCGSVSFEPLFCRSVIKSITCRSDSKGVLIKPSKLHEESCQHLAEGSQCIIDDTALTLIQAVIYKGQRLRHEIFVCVLFQIVSNHNCTSVSTFWLPYIVSA